jgi:hypothetical protein
MYVEFVKIDIGIAMAVAQARVPGKVLSVALIMRMGTLYPAF